MAPVDGRSPSEVRSRLIATLLQAEGPLAPAERVEQSGIPRAKVRPILAERMAAYITAHRTCYDHITTFIQSRYGEVMRLASEIAGVPFPVLPVETGPIVVTLGKSKPRTYWQKHWIQLTLQLIEWLDPDQRKQAEQRLRELKVKYRPGKGA